MVGVPVIGGRQLAVALKAVDREATDRVEQPVRGVGPPAVDGDERSVDQLVEGSFDLLTVAAVSRRAPPGHGAGAAHRERAGEHGEAVEQRRRPGTQQAVGPLDRVGDAAVTGRSPETGAVQDGGARVEPTEDVGDAERPRAGGGNLQRQGKAVETAAQLADSGRVELGRVDAGVTNPFEEQLHRSERRRVAVVSLRDGKRRHRHHRLAGQFERRAAGGQHGGLQARPQHLQGRGGHGIDEVLAVVDQQQGRAISGRGRQRLERVKTELAGDGAEHSLRVIDSGHVDGKHAIGEPVTDAISGNDGQRRLADATRPDNGHQPLTLQPGRDLIELPVTPDQRSGRHGPDGSSAAGTVPAPPPLTSQRGLS